MGAMDFTVNVKTVADSTAVDALEAKLKALDNKVLKFDTVVDDASLKNLQATIKSLQNTTINLKVNAQGLNIKNLQQLFGNAGKNAGQQFNKNLTTAISNKTINDSLDRMTKQGVNGKTQKLVEKRLQAIAKSGVQIKSVSGSFDRKNNNLLKIQVEGIDKLGTAITLVDTLNAATGKFKQTGKFKMNFDQSGLKNATSSITQMETQLKRLTSDFKNLKFDASFAKMQSQISQFSGQSSASLSQAKDALNQYKMALQNIKNHFDPNSSFKMNDTKLAQQFDKMKNSADRFKNAMQLVSTETSKSLSLMDANTAANRVATYYEKNTKAVQKYGNALKQLENQYRSATTVGEKSALDKQFANLKSQISAEGLTGTSFLAEAKRAFVQIGQFVGVYGLLQGVVMRIPGEMISAVKDINAAQIDLAKVSSASTGELASYYDKAAESARKYGATISDVIQSTADWSRLGYDLQEAEKLANATTLMQQVGDNMTQESSTEGIISTLRGFKMEADEVMTVIDSVNEVANTQPIDTAGLFEALSRSASSMSAANNTLSETIGLITAANSVVQDPATIGTAFKTISMRIRGAKTE